MTITAVARHSVSHPSNRGGRSLPRQLSSAPSATALRVDPVPSSRAHDRAPDRAPDVVHDLGQTYELAQAVRRVAVAHLAVARVAR